MENKIILNGTEIIDGLPLEWLFGQDLRGLITSLSIQYIASSIEDRREFGWQPTAEEGKALFVLLQFLDRLAESKENMLKK